MRLARTGGQRMVVYQAAPATPDEAAMLRLESPESRPQPAAQPTEGLAPWETAGETVLSGRSTCSATPARPTTVRRRSPRTAPPR
ncbi:hypothetical protein ACFZDI_09850 [Streptomyces sp. NPDC007907]|uniref:hypothetical protein n=1 Tax=Streptomyces sp. NPDC007907 TaxID=3364789 RepID=UPI0036E4B51F